MTTYRDKVIDQLREMLVGIDKTSIEEQGVDGWWETSTGADFGFNKLIEIESLISKALDEQRDHFKSLITAEIVQAQIDGDKTSRLTALFNKI